MFATSRADLQSVQMFLNGVGNSVEVMVAAAIAASSIGYADPTPHPSSVTCSTSSSSVLHAFLSFEKTTAKPACVCFLAIVSAVENGGRLVKSSMLCRSLLKEPSVCASVTACPSAEWAFICSSQSIVSGCLLSGLAISTGIVVQTKIPALGLFLSMTTSRGLVGMSALVIPSVSVIASTLHPYLISCWKLVRHFLNCQRFSFVCPMYSIICVVLPSASLACSIMMPHRNRRDVRVASGGVVGNVSGSNPVALM